MAVHATRFLSVVIGVVGVISGAHGSTPSVHSTLTLTEPTDVERVGAGLTTIDVAGIPSMDLPGSPFNTVVFLWIGPFNSVNGIGWDVVLETLVAGSRRRDIAMLVRDTNNNEFSGFIIRPGFEDPTPGGPTDYSSGGIIKFADYDIPPLQALADGLIRIEFAEGREDAIGAADAIWRSGSVRFQLTFEVPTPVSPSVAGLFGMAGIACLSRGCRRGIFNPTSPCHRR